MRYFLHTLGNGRASKRYSIHSSLRKLCTTGRGILIRAARCFDASMLHYQPAKLGVADLSSPSWGRYVAAVLFEFHKTFPALHGMYLLIHSEIPSGSGVSSSAALEVGVALAVQATNGISLTEVGTAALCKSAENGPFINSPCGMLDQASITLPMAGEVLFFDFGERATPFPKVQRLPVDFAKSELQFVLAVDQSVRRELATSGYSARRRSCDLGVTLASKFLGRPLSSLSEVTLQEFSDIAGKLEVHSGKETRNRVEHVISENCRVVKAREAILTADFVALGNLLTASGKSALDLYTVDEGTPELTFLVQESGRIDGVLGARNMGGGFAALSLSLVATPALPQFSETLNERYLRAWKRPLTFLPFSPAHHAELLEMTSELSAQADTGDGKPITKRT